MVDTILSQLFYHKHTSMVDTILSQFYHKHTSMVDTVLSQLLSC